ncbi:hypothetical protein SEA_ITZA_25 [Streptomyces phage Itza]|nr:hypothetical protein SEA_URZA_25 [Streptomyces phage Urza]QJD50590.1 hypothetical protein SEA_ITZA_25 [Streptomyces phage Itza]
MGVSIYPPPASPPAARGLVSQSPELDDTALIGTTETICYDHSFTAEANRVYKVTFQAATVDTDGTGANADYGSKGSARIIMRWAAGSSADTGTFFAEKWIATFGDNSQRATGVTMVGYFSTTASGTHTVALGMNMQYSSGGQVRFLMYGPGNRLSVEDVGPA